MIVVTGEATERRGLLVQFHEEDLRELQMALDLFMKYEPMGVLRTKQVPEWVYRLDAAVVAKLNDNRRSP
jgi:hypothetical protein